ncbi:MAG: PTS sugar transporter subunit IIA [Pontibacterium sp.]
MQIQQLITRDNSHCRLEGVSKKRVLETASELIADGSNLDADTVFSALLARERLGSTGFGEGVAIPHCRLEGCDSAHALLITLESAVDYDAADKQPVDLLLVLVVPDEAADEYLGILSEAVTIFNDASARATLRQAETSEALYTALVTLANQSA